MKSLTRDEIIALAEILALPDSHRLTYEFTEYALMEFVTGILNAATANLLARVELQRMVEVSAYG